MIIPIKQIILEQGYCSILEQMMSDQDKFSVVSGALTPQQTMAHNEVDTKPNIHDITMNRHRYGFASKDEASHLHNNHLTARKMAQYNNDLALINNINNTNKSSGSNTSTPM